MEKIYVAQIPLNILDLLLFFSFFIWEKVLSNMNVYIYYCYVKSVASIIAKRLN